MNSLRSGTHSLFLLLAPAMFLASALAGNQAAPQLAPEPHPVSRYAALLRGDWFSGPKTAHELDAPKLREEPFPFKAVGLGDCHGNTWVYLSDDQGHIFELTPGDKVAGLSLLQIDDQAGAGEILIFVRQGERTVSLKLSRQAASAFSSVQAKAKAKATGVRPYAAWQRSPATADAFGPPRHRIPGELPRPQAHAGR